MKILIFFLILFFSVFIGKIIVTGKLIILAALLFPIILFFTLKKLEIGLSFLIFFMLLSPEIKVGEVPGRSVVVRFDDILIIIVLGCWLAHLAYRKEFTFFTTTPLLLPIFFYTIACVLFTMRGIMLGYISFSKSFFYVLKYIEYFLIYLLTINIIKSKSSMNQMLIIGLITALIVCLYGYTLIGKVERIYAPFDVEKGRGGEAATLGGYLLIVMSLFLAFFCYSDSILSSIFFGFLFLFALPPFAYTLSRASFFGFLPMFLTILLFTEKKKLFLMLFSLLFILFAPVIFPKPTQDVLNRIKETFAGPEEETVILGFKVKELSALARVKNWQRTFSEIIPKQPFFGYGVTGVGLMDAQYPLILGEVGLIGFFFFLWILYNLFKVSLKTLSLDDNFYKSLSLGFLAGFVGLLFQAFTTNTFIIIRIMEPFWFLAGLVSIAPYVKQTNE